MLNIEHITLIKELRNIEKSLEEKSLLIKNISDKANASIIQD